MVPTANMHWVSYAFSARLPIISLPSDVLKSGCVAAFGLQ
jgi:ABC-type uncharacterized transport system substrate-binding protein